MSNDLAMRKRTKAFALQIIKLSKSLPETKEADVISKQLLQSGTIVGALFRRVAHSRSVPEYVAKIEKCLVELKTSLDWLDLLLAANIAPPEKVAEAIKEGNEIAVILVKAVKIVRSGR